jgi:hypothetical protein
VVFSRAESLTGHAYIQNFWKGIQSVLDNNSSLLSDNNLETLIRHNIGLLKNTETLSDLSKLLVDKYGKGTLFDPVLLNYVFVIESEGIKLSKSQGIFQGSPLNIDICSDSNSPAECLLSRIYNESTNIYIYTNSRIKALKLIINVYFLTSNQPQANLLSIISRRSTEKIDTLISLTFTPPPLRL